MSSTSCSTPNGAIDEVRRAELFRKGGRMRGLVKGKRWLLLTRWVNLSRSRRQELNHLFALNRKLLKAYLLKESLDRLWSYYYEGAMLRYLQSSIDQLRWQRLKPFEKLAWMGLCPDNDMSGGKVLFVGTRKVQCRAASALRMAAQSLHHSQSALGDFYLRMRAKTPYNGLCANSP